MEISKNKMHHILGVARLMYKLSIEDGKDEEFAKEMFVLGFLHDIGYEFCEEAVNHPLIASEILDDYKYKNEIKYHGDISEKYNSYELNLLNKADLLISHTGEYIGAKKRIEYIKENYGKNSYQYNNSKLLAKKLNLL